MSAPPSPAFAFPPNPNHPHTASPPFTPFHQSLPQPYDTVFSPSFPSLDLPHPMSFPTGGGGPPGPEPLSPMDHPLPYAPFGQLDRPPMPHANTWTYQTGGWKRTPRWESNAAHRPLIRTYSHQPTPQSLPRSRNAPNQSGTSNIYVRLLPLETTDADLFALGSDYGRVRSVRALVVDNARPPTQAGSSYGPSSSSNLSSSTPSRIRTSFREAESPPQEKVCKGCGFILFATKEEAQVAAEGLNARGFEASFAKVDSPSLRLRQLSDESSTNLYIANLPLNLDEKALADLLAPWADVVSVRLIREFDSLPATERQDRGASRGIGFARVLRREQAQMVIDHLANQRLPGSTMPLRVRFADTDAQKRFKAQLSSSRGGDTGPPTLQMGRPQPAFNFPPSPQSPVHPFPGTRLPPRFANSRLAPLLQRSVSTPTAQQGATAPVAHKPRLSTSATEIALKARAERAPLSPPSLAQTPMRPRPGQINIAPIRPPMIAVGAAVGEGGEPSPPLTPTVERSGSPGMGLKAIAEGPKSAEPVRSTFARDGEGAEEGLKRRITWAGKKRDMFAPRKSLP